MASPGLISMSLPFLCVPAGSIELLPSASGYRAAAAAEIRLVVVCGLLSLIGVYQASNARSPMHWLRGITGSKP